MATEAETRPPERSAVDGGSVVGEDTGEPGAPHHAHPTEGKYIKIALFLAFITAVEVLVYYIEAIEDYLVAILITLSLLKFAIVVGYFMHLRFDSRLFRRLFVLGLVLALFVYTIVLTTFEFWNTQVIGALSAAVQFPEWHPHLDAWALMGAIEALYLIAVGRARRSACPTGRGQVALFSAGVAVLWLASDWPMHDVAEGYLYSAHMVQHLLFTLVAALLLVLGTPAWMGRRLLGIGRPGPPSRRLRMVRSLARPVPGLIQFNLVLVLSHWPAVVEGTVRYHPLHFVAHAVLLVSAILMWLPVASTVPEVPRARPLTQMVYLFLQTVVPTVPASFLTFGAKPLYRIYETFPRLWDVSALTDQQVAGLIMKIGAGFFLWTVIAVIFFRWYRNEEGTGRPGSAPPSPSEAGDDVLLWEDVERELRQLDHPSGSSPPRVPPEVNS